MLLALLIIDGVLCVVLFLVFCRWGRILRSIGEDLSRLEGGLRRAGFMLRGEGRQE